MLYKAITISKRKLNKRIKTLIESKKSTTTVNRALRVRVYPTNRQQEIIDATLDCCRFIYNYMIDRNEKAYSRRKEHLNYNQMQNLLPHMKEYLKWLKDADSRALQYACRQVDNAYKKFFKKQAGYPNFKRKRNPVQSYTTTNPSSIKYKKGKVQLPLLGNLLVRDKRLLPEGAIICMATVTKDHDRYYVSICYKYEKLIQPVKPTLQKSIGLDYKSNGLYMDSEGNCCAMPHYYQDMESKLAWEQHKLSRKVGSKKGDSISNNYKRQQGKLQKVSRHIANQRRDFLHKQSASIAKKYDAVCVESLNMMAMSNKSFGNGKATMNNGYGMFLSMLEYKLAEQGKQLIKVDKWFPSSQLCSCCGYRNKRVKSLSITSWTCPVCRTYHNRDKNAATNILYKGLELIIA